MTTVPDPITYEALPSRLTLLRPKPPQQVLAALRPLKDAEVALSEALRKDLRRQIDTAKHARDEKREQRSLGDFNQKEIGCEDETTATQLSPESQLLLDEFVTLCMQTYSKLAKFGHWLSSWEVIQKTEALVDAYGDQTPPKLHKSLQDRVFRMYGSYERLRQRGLESANCAPTKGLQSLLPADQRPDNIILQLHSLPVEARQQLIFGSRKKSTNPVRAPPAVNADGSGKVSTIGAEQAPAAPISRPHSARPPARPQSAKASNPSPSSETEGITTPTVTQQSTPQTQAQTVRSCIPDVMKVDKFYGRTDPRFSLQGLSRIKETAYPTRLQKRPTSAHSSLGAAIPPRPRSSNKKQSQAPNGAAAQLMADRPSTAKVARIASGNAPPPRPNSAKIPPTRPKTNARDWAAKGRSPYLSEVVPLHRQLHQPKPPSSTKALPNMPSAPIDEHTTPAPPSHCKPPLIPRSGNSIPAVHPTGDPLDPFVVVEDDGSDSDIEHFGGNGHSEVGVGSGGLDDSPTVPLEFPVLDSASVHITAVHHRQWPPYHMLPGVAPSTSTAVPGSLSYTTTNDEGRTPVRVDYYRQWKSPRRVTLHHLGETSKPPSPTTVAVASAKEGKQPIDSREPPKQKVDVDQGTNDEAEELLLEGNLRTLEARHDEKIGKIKQSLQPTTTELRIICSCARMFLAKVRVRRQLATVRQEVANRIEQENAPDGDSSAKNGRRRSSGVVPTRRDLEIEALEAQLSTRMAAIQAKVAKFKEAAIHAETVQAQRKKVQLPLKSKGERTVPDAQCCPSCGSPIKKAAVDESTQAPISSTPPADVTPVEAHINTQPFENSSDKPAEHVATSRRSSSVASTVHAPTKPPSFRHLRRDHLELAAAQTTISACYRRYSERATVCMKKGYEALGTFKEVSHLVDPNTATSADGEASAESAVDYISL